MVLSGSTTLAVIIAIVTGSLLVAAIVAAYLKFYFAKQKRQENAASSDLELARARVAHGARQSKRVGNKDVFGLRALQDAPYGAWPFATDFPTPTHSPSSSLSATLVGSRISRKFITASPNTSFISLPLEARHSSPLRLNPVAADIPTDVMVLGNATRQGRNRLRTWEGEIAASRPPTANHDNDRASTGSLSPTTPWPPPPISSQPPQLVLPLKDFRASFRSSLLPTTDANFDIKSQPAPVASSSTPKYSQTRSISGPSSPTIQDLEFPAPPLRVYRGDRPFFGGTVHSRVSSRSITNSASVVNRARGDSVKIRKSARVLSAVGDWGAAIFQEIDKSLMESRSLTASPDKDRQSTRPSSTASSVYSLHDNSNTDIRRSENLKPRQISIKPILKTNPIPLGIYELPGDTPPLTARSAPLEPSSFNTPPSPVSRMPTSYNTHPEPSSGASTLAPPVSSVRPNSDALSDVYDCYRRRPTPDGEPRPTHKKNPSQTDGPRMTRFTEDLS